MLFYLRGGRDKDQRLEMLSTKRSNAGRLPPWIQGKMPLSHRSVAGQLPAQTSSHHGQCRKSRELGTWYVSSFSHRHAAVCQHGFATQSQCAVPLLSNGLPLIVIHSQPPPTNYAATLALYLVAALSNSSLFSAKSSRKGCLGSAVWRMLSRS